MSNQMFSGLLSAAVDDAATAAEWDALLKATEDASVTAEWGRIWTARDALEGVQLCAGKDFCGGVMAAIASEKMLPSNVVSLPPRRASQPAVVRQTNRQWRSMLPLSAAAGVIAAVLFMGDFKLPGNGADAESQVARSALPLAGTPVAFNTAEDTTQAVPDEAKSAILNAYLMEHSNSLAERSMGGTLANARFAARTADYRPDGQ